MEIAFVVFAGLGLGLLGRRVQLRAEVARRITQRGDCVVRSAPLGWAQACGLGRVGSGTSVSIWWSLPGFRRSAATWLPSGLGFVVDLLDEALVLGGDEGLIADEGAFFHSVSLVGGLTHLGEDGWSASMLMVLSGHRNLRTLGIYVQPSTEALAAALTVHDSGRRRR